MDNQHRRPHPQPMAAPFLEFDLTRELEQLHCEAQPMSGQNAKTLVKYDDFRVVLIVLKAHSSIRNTTRMDESPSRPSVVTSACARERTFDLPAGSLLALEQGVKHDVEALQDSALLLTIAWPGRR
jgi:hypothetical protein